MHLIVRCLLATALACATTTCAAQRPAVQPQAAQGPWGRQERTLQHDKLDRKYVLYVPRGYVGQYPVPLVVALHGQGGDGDNILKKGWPEKADREGFFVLAPDSKGDPPAWNSGYNNGRNLPVDDVSFLIALVDRTQSEFRIDPKRVYFCGLSSGAMMSYRMAAEIPQRIAAIAPVAGSIGAKLTDRGGEVVTIPVPKHPVSIFAIHGKADTNVPYDGSTNRGVNFLPVSESIAFWVKHDGCSPKVVRQTLPGGNVVIDRYPSGKGGTEVVLVTIENGEHAWPGSNQAAASKDFNATDVIWNFFKTHPKR